MTRHGGLVVPSSAAVRIPGRAPLPADHRRGRVRSGRRDGLPKSRPPHQGSEWQAARRWGLMGAVSPPEPRPAGHQLPHDPDTDDEKGVTCANDLSTISRRRPRQASPATHRPAHLPRETPRRTRPEGRDHGFGHWAFSPPSTGPLSRTGRVVGSRYRDRPVHRSHGRRLPCSALICPSAALSFGSSSRTLL